MKADHSRPSPFHLWNGFRWEEFYKSDSNLNFKKNDQYREGYLVALNDLTILAIDDFSVSVECRQRLSSIVNALKASVVSGVYGCLDVP